MRSYRQLLPFLTLLCFLALAHPVTGYDDTNDVSTASVSKYVTNDKILGEGMAPERCSEKVTITRCAVSQKNQKQALALDKQIYKQRNQLLTVYDVRMT